MLLVLLYSLSAIVFLCGKIGNPTSGTLPFRVCFIVFNHSLYCTCYVFCFILEAIKHLVTWLQAITSNPVFPRVSLFNVHSWFFRLRSSNKTSNRSANQVQKLIQPLGAYI